MDAFKNIIIIGKANIVGISNTLNELKSFLLQHNRTLFIESATATLMDTENTTVIPAESIPESADLIIVVGGDGSLLNAAHVALASNLPILGVHRGRLGFLTDIPPNDLQQIEQVLNGDYLQEKRTVLNMTLTHAGKTLSEGFALNDVVLLPGDSTQMIKFDTYINTQFVYQQRADGLIVSTPTGSTAYALSGGGPILHPSLEAIELVPMFPHTLSSRPLVVPDDSCIEIHLCNSNQQALGISCDGLTQIEAPPDAIITITKYKNHIQLIHPTDYTYYKTLREKLGWERHAQRK